MLLIMFTWLITTAIYGLLVWLAVRRVVKHLQGNDAGMKAVVEHVLLPVLGKTETENEEPAKVQVKEKKRGQLV